MSVSTVPTDTIHLGFNLTSQCQSAQFSQIPSIWALTLAALCQSVQFPQIPSIWALTNQLMSVSTVLTETIYLGFNQQANVSQQSSHRYHLSGL